MIPFVSHLAEVMVFFRLLEVKGFPLFFTRSCQQVVKHVVVSAETNGQVIPKLPQIIKTQCGIKRAQRKTSQRDREDNKAAEFLFLKFGIHFDSA